VLWTCPKTDNVVVMMMMMMVVVAGKRLTRGHGGRWKDNINIDSKEIA